MTEQNEFVMRPIGFIRSPLLERENAPKQGSEGAPSAWVEIEPIFAEGLDGVETGSELILLTWFHKADRRVLKVHPRGDPANPVRGVFLTRSPDRPNPLGLHRVKVIEYKFPGHLKVYPLEAIDGTPVIDIKLVLDQTRDA